MVLLRSFSAALFVREAADDVRGVDDAEFVIVMILLSHRLLLCSMSTFVGEITFIAKEWNREFKLYLSTNSLIKEETIGNRMTITTAKQY